MYRHRIVLKRDVDGNCWVHNLRLFKYKERDEFEYEKMDSNSISDIDNTNMWYFTV